MIQRIFSSFPLAQGTSEGSRLQYKNVGSRSLLRSLRTRFISLSWVWITIVHESDEQNSCDLRQDIARMKALVFGGMVVVGSFYSELVRTREA